MPVQIPHIIRSIFSVDRRQRIISWSEDLEKIYGKSSCAVQGTPYYKIFPRINKGSTDAVTQVLRSGRTMRLKGYQIPCFCGELKANIQITPSKDKNGKVYCANIIIEAQPSCTISKSLKQSQRLVDIGKIAATLAHGMRSPLNAIKGSVVYIREKYVNEKKLCEFTNIIEEEISRLDNFIAKFLSTSIYDNGLSETDINSLLKKIEALIYLQAKSYKIETNFEYGNIPHVMLNSFQLEQAILNVINNAIEAMPSGGRLSVKTKSEIYSGNEYSMIKISDTGLGMGKGRTDDITTTSKENGKGLGLFITREILQSCGGHFEIKSKRGLGTTAKLYIPINKNGSLE
jgi:two-component system nitrogen regulation sensor histidine kinase GlnL